jgi:hypothetical protein
MINKQKLISIFSILSGIILALMGMLGIGVYLFSGIAVLDQPDKSIIFWYLPILFIGIILLCMAVYFIIIGLRSHKGKDTDYRLAKNSLIILSVCFFILLVIGIVNSIFA